MPKFIARVEISGEIIVEGADMYEADANARKLSLEEIMANLRHVDYEVCPDEFPEEY